ncbi:MAG TPA: hypothetical protein VFN22_10490 [Gemmatimonadales bacterium]|nr:hypothetical protein [Gemmatimonadales bacterium]
MGLGAAALARLTGGTVIRRDGIIEAQGGVLATMLPRLGVGVQPLAMTLGHAVLAVDQEALDLTRDHERVHVRQAERWGPLFPLAYAAASLGALATGGDPYHDNLFEREACQGS